MKNASGHILTRLVNGQGAWQHFAKSAPSLRHPIQSQHYILHTQNITLLYIYLYTKRHAVAESALKTLHYR